MTLTVIFGLKNNEYNRIPLFYNPSPYQILLQMLAINQKASSKQVLSIKIIKAYLIKRP